jgi:glycosyltransferase involved in cell wall biosynthesis
MKFAEFRPITFCIDHLRGDGAQKWLVSLARGLAHRGHDVLVIALNERLSTSVVSALESAGVGVVVIGRIPLLFGFGFLKILKNLYKRRSGVLISVLFFSDIVSVTLAKMVGFKRVVQAVRSRNQDYNEVRWFLRRLTVKMIDVVVYNSNTALKFEEARMDLAVVSRFVVYNSIPSRSVLADSENQLNSSLDSEVAAAKSLRIGVVGRLAAEKNIEVIIRALAHSGRGDILLLVAGEGHLRKKLAMLCIELGVSNQVKFLGYQDDPLGFLSTLDLMVSASRFEGQPNALLEVIEIGCPFILSDIEEHRETVNILAEDLNVEPLFFIDNSVASLADKFRGLPLGLDDVRNLALIMNSRKSRLSYERMISAWTDILFNL